MVLNSEWIQLEVIDLINDGSGLGFGIIGGKSTGVVIKTILPGGVSDRDGRLKSGDHIIQIGDVGVRGLTSEQVALILRQCGVLVHMIVARSAEETAQLPQPFAPIIRMSEMDLELDRLNKLMTEPRGFPEAMLMSTTANGEAVAIKENVSSLTQSLDPDPVEPDPDTFEIELAKDLNGLGITISGYTDPSDAHPDVFISGITEGSVAAQCHRLRIGHRITAVDDRSLNGFTSHEALELLRRTGQVVRLKIAGMVNFTEKRLVPVQQKSRNVNPIISSPADSVLFWKKNCGRDYEIVYADLTKFKDGGGLGISLEGTVDLESNEEKNPRHFIGTILPDGPVGQNGQLRTGDELLQVNDTRLAGLSPLDVVRILKDLPRRVSLICARRHVPLKATSQQTNGMTVAGTASSPDRLVKAKSEQTLLCQELNPQEDSLLNHKSRSLEPLGIGGLALWSSDPTTLELLKEDKGLGFSVIDYQDQLDPDISMVVIRSLVPGGVAQVDGRLVPGDRLISVNEILLVNATLSQAVEALKGAPKGVVRIGILKPLPIPDQDESTSKDTSIDEPEFAMENVFPSLSPTPSQIPLCTAPQAPAPHAHRMSPSPVSAAYSAETLSAPALASQVSSRADQAVYQENLPVARLDVNSVMTVEADLTGTSRSHQPVSSGLISPVVSPSLSSSPRLFTAFVPSSIGHDIHLASKHSDVLSSAVPLQTIRISFSSGQLGLRLESEGSRGCVIRSIEPGGIISKDGRLQLGDYILAINDESLQNASNAQARSMLRRISLLGSDFSVTFIRDKRFAQTASLSAEDDVSLPSSSNIGEWLHSSSPLPCSSESNSRVKSSFILQSTSPLPRTMTASPPSIPGSPSPGCSRSSSSHAVYLKGSGSGLNIWGPERTIRMHRKQGENLGISVIASEVEVPEDSIADDRHTVSGIFVKRILASSPAAESGKLSVGDRILEVDGIDLRNVSREFAMEVIRKSKSLVSFLVQSSIGSGSVSLPSAEELLAGFDSPTSSFSSLGELKMKYAELDGELHMVELQKDSSGLGLSLAGNRCLSTMSVFVVGVKPDSAAGKSRMIQIGDELLEINEHVLYGRSHLNASSIIKSVTTPQVRLILLRRNDFLQQMAVHPFPSPRNSPSPQDLSSTLIRGSRHTLERKESSKDSSFPSDSDVSCSNEITFDPMVFTNIRCVKLEKGSQGFGFAIEERHSSDNGVGIFVRCLTTDGAAAKEGMMSVGDQLLMVNDKSLLGCTYEQALDVLRLISRGVTATLVLNSQHQPLENHALITAPVANSVIETGKDAAEGEVVVTAKESPCLHEGLPPTVPVGDEDLSSCSIIPGKEITIEITKEKSGLGLSIVGGSDTLLGSVIIHEVYEDGAAAKDGRLWAGDQIIAVNGEDLRNVTHERAIQVLRQTPPVVQMVVFRDGSPLKDEDLYDTQTVEMVKKPGRGLGFSIVGKQNGSGVFIADFVKGGAAEADGRLTSGDQILSINGNDVSDANQEQVAEMLKVAMGTIKLRVSRLKVGSSVDGPPNLNQGMKKSASNLSNSKLSKRGEGAVKPLSIRAS